MAHAEGLNLREFIRRLWGPLSRAEPEVVENIQPVYVVGDGSVLVPPLLPPAAIAGGSFAPAVGTFAAASFQCRAPGGAFLRSVRAINVGSNPVIRYGLFAAPPAFTASTISTNYNFGSAPVASVLTLGQVAAPVLLVTDPTTGGFDGPIFVDEFFVPPGRFFWAEHFILAAAVIHWHFIWTEVPAVPGPA